MAVTVTDRRTPLDQADSTTNWTGAGFGTTTSDIAESIAAVAAALNIASGQVYYTLPSGSLDLSNTLVYVYSFNSALQLSWTTGSHALMLGDGTDRIAFHMAGSDRRVFSHSDGPTNWQSLVLDGSQASTMNSAGETTVVAGSFAGLALTAITQVGSHFITQSKALGGGYNVAVDIIRYGNDGIRITAGGSGTEGNFSEIVTEDRSTADLKGHGIIRELTTGVYGCQGPLTFGDSGSATNSYFEDSGIVLAYEDRNISNDKYYFNIEGNSGATNSFVLSGSTISSAGPFVVCNFASGNINTLTLNTVTFSQLGNTITFSNNADASGHTVSNCTFDGCGQIDPGDVNFSGNTILVSTASATGALLLDADGSSNWSNLSFTSGGTGHAIYITTAGSYTFSNFIYSGYGSTGTTDAAIYNDSGGSVTINVSGGNSPTYRNGAGATTTIVASVSIAVHVEDNSGSDIVGAQVFIRKSGAYYNYTSHNTNNAVADATFEVNEAVDTDLPQTGWLHVWDSSTNTKQEYRYTSWSGTVFSLNPEVTGSATSNGSSISLISTSTNFTTVDIQEGDTIRNTTDGSWAVVDEIVDADNITTTALVGGSDNTWQSGDAFSLHRLAIAYDNTDLVDIPLFNGQTDSNGDIATTFGGTTPASVVVRVRSNQGATKYIPFSTSGTITSSGYSLTAVLAEDTVAT